MIMDASDWTIYTILTTQLDIAVIYYTIYDLMTSQLLSTLANCGEFLH